MIGNATCVKSLGLFRLTPSYLNYTETILNCQNLSGDLADVTSEYRTVMLAQFINASMPNDWYKAVFVGLDDLDVEGMFRNSYGKPLTCSRSVFIHLNSKKISNLLASGRGLLDIQEPNTRLRIASL